MRRPLTIVATALLLLSLASPASAAPAQPDVPAGVRAGYVVLDRKTGRVTVQHDAHRRFRSASVVKILIAIDYLESHRDVPRRDLALLGRMLRVSDDAAATSFWTRGGRGRIVERTARRLGLTDTAPPPADKPGFWGYTSLSAMDVVRAYRYLLDRAAPRVRDIVLGHLRAAEQCGSDGFDQYFGIPRAVPRPWAVKQGWSGYGSTPPVRCAKTAPASGGAVPATWRTASLPARPAAVTVPDLGHPVLHTTGLVGPEERWIMVLLTAHPSTATWSRSTAQTTTLARRIYLAGARTGAR
ncbi:hypothetical protein ABT340_23880 [Streptosporangium sp. NPDC000239]|uniref:hypothetical protein n=1 Tax=Streptosporangium sp. NPDC000239 TaxID=3154248 RepID=UPI00331B4F72